MSRTLAVAAALVAVTAGCAAQARSSGPLGASKAPDSRVCMTLKASDTDFVLGGDVLPNSTGGTVLIDEVALIDAENLLARPALVVPLAVTASGQSIALGPAVGSVPAGVPDVDGSEAAWAARVPAAGAELPPGANVSVLVPARRSGPGPVSYATLRVRYRANGVAYELTGATGFAGGETACRA